MRRQDELLLTVVPVAPEGKAVDPDDLKCIWRSALSCWWIELKLMAKA